MITLRVSSGTIQQLTSAALKLAGAEEKIKDRRRVLRDIRKKQAQRWEDTFDTHPWTPTSSSYQKERIRKGNSPTPTLEETGALRSHFTAQNKAGRVNAASITWNFSNKEGAYTVSHHTGYSLGENEIPSRMLWDITPNDERYIVNELETWVGEVLGDIF